MNPGSHRRVAKSGTGGLTLIEIIIAMAVFALAALAVLSAIGNSTSIDAASWETNLALLAAKAKLEEITAAGYDAAPNYGMSPKNAFAVSGLVPPVAGVPVGSIQVVKLTSASSAVYDVTLRIRWSGVQGIREEVLKTMIAEKP